MSVFPGRLNKVSGPIVNNISFFFFFFFFFGGGGVGGLGWVGGGGGSGGGGAMSKTCPIATDVFTLFDPRKVFSFTFVFCSCYFCCCCLFVCLFVCLFLGGGGIDINMLFTQFVCLFIKPVKQNILSSF